MVMEKVTQYKIGTEIKKRFISPFKLKNTFFATAPFIEANYAQGYGEHNETLTLVNPSVSWAAGAMVSNLTDLSLWVKILAKADRFTDKTKNELFKFVDTDTPLIQNGLGIMKAGQFLGYSGHAPGYSSIMFYLPERDTTLIVLLNKFPDNGAAMEIFKQISKMLYPREAKF
jgi:D-alanyl-D-alanine carboxypeptidase